MNKRSRFGPWIAVLVVLVFLGGVLPKGLLAGRQGWFTTLFWPAFGLAAIVVIVAGVRGWRGR